mmetsp:Transcript_64790/g.186192  ORF Transcript_64790/g.186192 Transcript_64790/m.186192 type:complete len:222 (-) Transcript_64790:7-672(-)
MIRWRAASTEVVDESLILIGEGRDQGLVTTVQPWGAAGLDLHHHVQQVQRLVDVGLDLRSASLPELQAGKDVLFLVLKELPRPGQRHLQLKAQAYVQKDPAGVGHEGLDEHLAADIDHSLQLCDVVPDEQVDVPLQLPALLQHLRASSELVQGLSQLSLQDFFDESLVLSDLCVEHRDRHVRILLVVLNIHPERLRSSELPKPARALSGYPFGSLSSGRHG